MNAKATQASIELAEAILESGNPLLEYLALAIGEATELNYKGVTDILNNYQDEFEALGANDLLENIRDRIDKLFLDFINQESQS